MTNNQQAQVAVNPAQTSDKEENAKKVAEIKKINEEFQEEMEKLKQERDNTINEFFEKENKKQAEEVAASIKKDI